MNTAYTGYILERSTIPIEEHIAQLVTEKVRVNCCKAGVECEGLCNVARHEYRMLWLREWEKYARSN